MLTGSDGGFCAAGLELATCFRKGLECKYFRLLSRLQPHSPAVGTQKTIEDSSYRGVAIFQINMVPEA